MPVRDGKFEVPPEITGALRVTFRADVDGDQIRISELPANSSGWKAGHFSWRSGIIQIIADRAIPKETDIPASCIPGS